MTVQPRKIVLPVVLGVWAIAACVLVHTVTGLPWVIDRYDIYAQQPGVTQATIATLYRHGYPLGAVPVGAILIWGALLLKQREIDTERLVWFACTGLVVGAIWFTWTLLVERSVYVLSVAA